MLRKPGAILFPTVDSADCISVVSFDTIFPTNVVFVCLLSPGLCLPLASVFFCSKLPLDFLFAFTQETFLYLQVFQLESKKNSIETVPQKWIKQEKGVIQ